MLQIDQNKKEKSDFYTLGTCVYSVLHDLQESEARFAEYLNYAQDLWRELQVTHNRQVEVQELYMNTYKQIDMPKNMIDWVKIGIRCGDTIKTFVYDDNISKLYDKDQDGIPLKHKSCDHIDDLSTSDSTYYYGLSPMVYYDNVQYDYEYLGIGVHGNGLGYFNVDWKRRVINFKETVSKNNKIYLEYISDGINPTERTIITNPVAFNLVKLWIKWQRKENNDRYGLGEKDRAQRLYNNKLMDYDIAMMDEGISAIRDAQRQGFTQVPSN